MRLIDADEMAKNESEAYISAQAKITSPVTLGLNSVVHRKMQQLIADTPTIDPESLRPQGEWIDNHCTACGETPLGEELWEHIDGEPPRFERCMDYCPCCGAKMKGGTP